MKYVGWIMLAPITCLAMIVVILSVRLHKAEHTNERYNEICRSISGRMHLAALDAARNDQSHLNQIGIEHAVHYDYSILQACAIEPPIDTNAMSECWVMGDMPCLARELDKIAAQLPSWRNR